MRADDIRFLFGYDRWASGRVLASSMGVDEFDWSDPNRIDRRGLGGILVHALGAHERWRSGWEGGEIVHRREHDPLLTTAELAAAWEDEWAYLEGFLRGLADADLDPRLRRRAAVADDGPRGQPRDPASERGGGTAHVPRSFTG
jgi:hypothetical protein